MKILKQSVGIVGVSFLVLNFGISPFPANAQEQLREEKRLHTWRPAREERVVIVKFRGSEREQRIRLGARETVEAALQRYQTRKDVLYAEPNYIATAFFVPNDTYYSYQWHVEQIGMEQAWDISTGSGVVVAVIDTGVAYEDYGWGWWGRYYQAPDLASTAFVQGYDFVNRDSHANDDNGHGTHVAGTIAQSTNNSLGVAGVAYGASIMPLKALDYSGSGTYADIADAIRYATDNGADVINMSFGGAVPATYLQEALAYAHEKGVTMVAAVGNDGAGSISYPAAYDDYVIAVGATRYDKQKAPYSNYGSSLDVVAPGGDTSVDQNGDGYGDGVLQQTFSGPTSNFGYYFYQGTSMASPHVAGLAALVIANGVASNPQGVRGAIESSAEDLGSVGWDFLYGHGLINAAVALQAGSPPLPPSPSPNIVFEENFENGLNNWKQGMQEDWESSRQRAVDGQYSAQVDGRAQDAQLISPAIHFQGDSNATVEFSWYIEGSVDRGEYIAFDVSTNNGQTWEEKVRLRGNEDEEDIWHPVHIDVLNVTSLQLRFRGTMSRSNEDANVDNVVVSAMKIVE